MSPKPSKDDSTGSSAQSSHSSESDSYGFSSPKLLAGSRFNAHAEPQRYDHDSDIPSTSSICADHIGHLTLHDPQTPDRCSPASSNVCVVNVDEPDLNISPQQSTHGTPVKSTTEDAGPESPTDEPDQPDSLASRSLWELNQRRRKHDMTEAQRRRDAEARYRETGDIHVFDEFLAPFAQQDGKNKADTCWKWDREYERWYMDNPATQSKYWAPEF